MKQIIKQRITHRLQSFLHHQMCPPPTVFFLVFLITHSQIQLSPPDFGQILFSFAVIVVFVCNMNFLFTMSPFIGCSNIPLSLLMFATCSIACNQKWKTYLFMLSIGDGLFSDSNYHSVFLSLFATFICISTYKHLIFRTLEDNQQFFAGFFAIAIYYGVKSIQKQTEEFTSIWYIIPGQFLAVVLGYSIISNKLQLMKKGQIEHDKDGRVMAHYLKMVQLDILQIQCKKAKVKLHSSLCQKISCFCKNTEVNHRSQYFMRQLYEDAINEFKDSGEPLLWERYVQFLLDNNQIINALHFLGTWKDNGYFMAVAKIKVQAKIKHLLANQNSDNLYEKQYQYALQYDRICLRIACQINQILKLKAVFWAEVGSETPMMVKLQREGVKIVQKMHALNEYYGKTVKKLQATIYSFDATILYGMYLLSTTNFKQYAETIIKNTAKLLEQVYVYDNSAAQTYAIRTVVQDLRMSYIGSKADSLRLLRDPNVSQSRLQYIDRSDFKLIIDAVSSGFCRLIKISKAELLGEQLNCIIPEGYKQVHNARLNYLLDFQNQQLREIVPSKVMHNQLRLPIKGVNGNMFMGFICIKFQVDIEKGLTFVSVIKRVHDKTMNALLDFQGRITEKEEGFLTNILEHTEIKKYIQGLKQSWTNQKVIHQEKFNVMINTANFGVTIGSPFLGLFLEKQNLRDKTPPIHISIVNQEKNRFKAQQNEQNNKMAQQIKRMETAIVNYGTQSSTASTKSTNSAISVLSVFSQNNSIPVYRCIQIVFLIVIVGCFTANLCFFMTAKLQWDPSSSNNNPINDTINMYTIEMVASRTLLNVADLIYYYTAGPYLNTTKISSYFGVGNYLVTFSNLMNQFSDLFQDNMFKCLRNSSKLLQSQINSRFQAQLTVANVLGRKTYIPKPTQNVTYLQLVMNYAVDIQLFALNKFESVLIYSTFNQIVVQAQNATTFISIIDQSLHSSQNSNLVVGSCLIGFILLLMIPLTISLRRRLPIHERVFDLIASLDAEMVLGQIKSLDYISNILKNYSDSNQILKSNFKDYQQNKICPPSKANKRASVENSIVFGLQKYDSGLTKKKQNSINRDSLNGLSKRSSLVNHTTLFSNIKEQVNACKIPKIYRKRGGELELKDSDSDTHKKVLFHHFIILFCITIFTVFLAFSMLQVHNFTSSVRLRKDEIITNFTDQIVLDLQMLTMKIYLQAGFSMVSNLFSYPDQLKYIKSAVSSVGVYNYFYKSNESDIIKACRYRNSQMSYKTIQKYCQLQYSYILLKGQMATLIKQLIEMRYTADKNIMYYAANKAMMVYYYNIFQIAEKEFYLQSLNNKLEDNVVAMTQVKIQDLAVFSEEHNQFQFNILIVSLIWGLLTAVTGFGIIIKKKRTYFKQIYTITFLSSDMILSSKRVQSFLESLAKNNTH